MNNMQTSFPENQVKDTNNLLIDKDLKCFSLLNTQFDKTNTPVSFSEIVEILNSDKNSTPKDKQKSVLCGLFATGNESETIIQKFDICAFDVDIKDDVKHNQVFYNNAENMALLDKFLKERAVLSWCSYSGRGRGGFLYIKGISQFKTGNETERTKHREAVKLVYKQIENEFFEQTELRFEFDTAQAKFRQIRYLTPQLPDNSKVEINFNPTIYELPEIEIRENEFIETDSKNEHEPETQKYSWDKDKTPLQNEFDKCLWNVRHATSVHEELLKQAGYAAIYLNLIGREVFIQKFSEAANEAYLSQKREPAKTTMQTIVDSIKHQKKRIDKGNCFWYVSTKTVHAGKDNERTEEKLCIDISKLYQLFEKHGFMRYCFADNELNRILIRVKNHIVSRVDIGYMEKFLFRYVQKLPFAIAENYTREDLNEMILKSIHSLITEDKINYSLKFETIKFLKDSPDKAYFFFKNCFVEVSKNGIETKQYSDLKGYIWNSQIIEHDFKTDYTVNVDTLDFAKFLQNTCTNEKDFDEKRFNSLIHVIGYLLHNYKSPSNTFAIIFSEANTNDKEGGRTGKGLIMQGINKMRKTTVIEGKNFSFEKQFALQLVELDTQVLFFDDVNKYFNFQKLYSHITEGLSFEKKYLGQVHLQPKDSPKIVISTNYTIKGDSSSDNGRKFEMELFQYYSDKHKPIHDFKVDFFSEAWDGEHWNLFYNFMFQCTCIYFQNDCIIPQYESDTIEQRKLLHETGKDFIEYAETLTLNEWTPVSEVYSNLLAYTGQTDKEFSIRKLKGYLLKYCSFKGLKLDYKMKRLNETNQMCSFISN